MVRPLRYVRTRDSEANSEVVMALLHALGESTGTVLLNPFAIRAVSHIGARRTN